MKITLVPTVEIDAVWPEVSRLLKPAIDRCGGRYDVPSVARLLREERLYLWVAYHGTTIKCALVVNIVEYPVMRVMNILFLAGVDRRNWLAVMHDKMTAFARDIDARKIECIGRTGWARDAGKFGYTSPGQLFEYILED